MTNAFIDRVLRERIVDTANYRYIVQDMNDAKRQWAEIRRIPLDKLDTAAAYTDWETVKTIE